MLLHFLGRHPGPHALGHNTNAAHVEREGESCQCTLPGVLCNCNSSLLWPSHSSSRVSTINVICSTIPPELGRSRGSLLEARQLSRSCSVRFSRARDARENCRHVSRDVVPRVSSRDGSVRGRVGIAQVTLSDHRSISRRLEMPVRISWSRWCADSDTEAQQLVGPAHKRLTPVACSTNGSS